MASRTQRLLALLLLVIAACAGTYIRTAIESPAGDAPAEQAEPRSRSVSPNNIADC